MSNNEILTLLIAGAACVASILATLAAFRSARSSQEAQDALIAANCREVRRQVADIVAEIEREHRRTKFLAHTIQVIDRANAILNGQSGGSREKLLDTSTVSRLEAAEKLARASGDLLEQRHVIATLTIEDADRIRLDRTVDLARLRAINDEFARDSTSREAQLMQNREISLQRASRN